MSDSIRAAPTGTSEQNSALTSDGMLKDAEDIEWYFSESSNTPMNVAPDSNQAQQKTGM